MMAFYLIDYVKHNYILLFALLGIVMVTEIGDGHSKERIQEQRLIMLGIFLLSIMDCVDYDIKRYGGPLYVRITAAVIGYWIRPCIGYFAIIMMDKKKQDKAWMWLPLVLNALVYSTCFFSGICISFKGNQFIRGPLYITVYICSFFYAILFIWFVGNHMRQRLFRENLILCFTVAVIVAAAIIDSGETRNTYLFPALAVGFLFYYVYLQLQQRKLRDLQWKLEQQEQQNELMISQIQPHFMYNTLATVSYLCSVDPPLAEKTINQFANYLRQNMNVIGTKAPIPFEKELEHTRIYTEIEKLRFDNIEVIYNIENEDFLIPALTVQPMVENAIRHGVRARAHGVVEVHTWRTQTHHMIEISDNGVGFDTNAPMSADRPHIGLKNVKTRLKGMVNGSMKVNSVIGQGTIILISIPVEEGEEE